MAVKKNKDFEVTWQCECGKWNFGEATHCWKCHKPKLPSESKRKKSRPKKELANAT